MSDRSKYWLVGAMMGGNKDGDMYEKFIDRGHWFMGWGSKEQPNQADLVEKMEEGDCIAIKKMLGKGSTEISIRALGIIKEVSDESYDLNGTSVEDRRVYVDWLVKDMDRRVPVRGCVRTVNGPFSPDSSDEEEAEWIRRVFYIQGKKLSG